MKSFLLTTALATTMASSHAATVALDVASNYSGWTDGSNQGTGFGAWTLREFDGSGAAGFFLANTTSNTDLNNIATSNVALGTFANGSTFEQAVAYRGFTGGSLFVGQIFGASFEHGNITSGANGGTGAVGLTLRTGNTNGGVGDYNAGSRFEFAFVGGNSNYSIFDGGGSFDTGIGFTNGGLELALMLTGADSYNLTITRKADNQVFTFNGRTLGGTSGAGLDSFALFNRNANDGDVFFNSFSVVPEPSRVLLLGAGLLGLLMRRRRQ
jgi:hypothetical protein